MACLDVFGFSLLRKPRGVAPRSFQRRVLGLEGSICISTGGEPTGERFGVAAVNFKTEKARVENKNIDTAIAFQCFNGLQDTLLPVERILPMQQTCKNTGRRASPG